MFTEDMAARRLPNASVSARTRSRSRRMWLRPAPPRRRHHRAAACECHRPAHPHGDDRLLPAPADPAASGLGRPPPILHEDDVAAATVRRATLAPPAGTVNVAGDGIITVSQATADRCPSSRFPAVATRGANSPSNAPGSWTSRPSNWSCWSTAAASTPARCATFSASNRPGLPVAPSRDFVAAAPRPGRPGPLRLLRRRDVAEEAVHAVTGVP